MRFHDSIICIACNESAVVAAGRSWLALADPRVKVTHS
jgi:hypothetical protein